MVEMDNLPAHKSHVNSTEISLFDEDNKRSVVSLVTPIVRQAIQDHVFTHGELFNIDERDLYQRLRNDQKQPSPTDNRLRIRFWDEYDRTQAQNFSSMNMVNVVAGICSREFFYANYLKRAEKVAWLLCPPAGYMTKAEEALEFGLEQLRDILDQPHVLGGKVDTKLGELKAKIVMMLDVRVKGAVVQKSLNMNISTSKDQVEKAATAITAEDLMRQLKDLDRKNRQAQNLPLVTGGKPDIEIK